MSVPYEAVVEDHISSDEENRFERPEIYFMQMPSVRGQRWPKSIGIVQLILGFLISFLGLMEVLIVPISENHTAILQINKSTCYGAGLWAGLVMVLTGSTAVRAALSKRRTTVYRFYNLTVFALLVYAGLTIFLIVAYCLGWTTEEAYPLNSHMHVVHMFVTILMVLGLLFALTAVLQYYQLICCDLKLWRNWLQCLCRVCWKWRQVEPSLEQDRLDAPADFMTVQ